MTQDNHDPYIGWWRDATLDRFGLANVFDLHNHHRIVTTRHSVDIFEHALLGRMLVIDDRLQMAEYNNVRREMMAHVPLLGRRRDAAILLILGGGSGELLQQVLRHPWVERVVVIDDDAGLIEIAATRLGFEAAFADKRVEQIIVAADEVISRAADYAGLYDVIFIDRYQPQPEVSAALPELIRDDGVIVTAQTVMRAHDAAGMFLDSDPSPLVVSDTTLSAQCYQAIDPLVAGGLTAFLLHSKDGHSYSIPQRSFRATHYNEALHQAAFALPCWWRARLDQLTATGSLQLQKPAVGAHAPLWFEHTQGTGITQALRMTPVYREDSAFQQIEYYRHERFGRVFVLDGTVQGSEADECIYHEMAVHVPLLGRRRDSIRALIIGGGDGGILRELLRYDQLTHVVMAEIDARVIDSSNTYFGIQGDYHDPRVELHIGDAAEYVARAADSGVCFDLIIVDATDSTEPSANLWNDAFFANLARCLSDDGVCLDSDILIHGRRTLLSRDLHGEGLRDIRRAHRFFAGIEGYYTKVPLFPGGYFAFFLYSKDRHSYADPYRDYAGVHYNANLHRAAFALPSWWQQLLQHTEEADYV